MNYDKLVQQLDLTPPAAKEVDLLRETIMTLVSHLRVLIPNGAPALNQFYSEMEQQFHDLRRRHYSVKSYFTGHGALANKLRDFLVLDEHFQTQDDAASPQYIRTVEEQLARFDFKPTSDPELIKQLKDFIVTLRPTVLNKTFRSPKPALVGNLNFDQIESGIYGDPADAEKFIIVLRTSFEPREQVETLLIYQKQQANLWYFHPFEARWINSLFDVTFDGVLEQLQQEFEKAVAAAEPIVREVTFEEELLVILQKANSVFENEQLLPIKYEMPPERTDKRFPLLPTGFERTMDDSCIIVSADSYSLLIRNTRGAYPSRTYHFMQNYTTLPSTATVDEMSESVKRMLIKRAHSAFNNLETIIEQARQQRNK